MNKLTPNQLLFLNSKVVSEDPEDVKGKTKLAKLSEIANAPYERNADMAYRYYGTVEKAVVLGHAITAGKPFAAGNTETAILAMLTFLELNGHRLTGYKDAIRELGTYLEEGEKEAAYDWICRHGAEKEQRYHREV